MDQVDRAISLMRDALALLDAAGEGIAAARLQHAIDTIRPDPMPEELVFLD